MKRREFRGRDGARVASHLGKFPLEKRVQGDELAEGYTESEASKQSQAPRPGCVSNCLLAILLAGS